MQRLTSTLLAVLATLLQRAAAAGAEDHLSGPLPSGPLPDKDRLACPHRHVADPHHRWYIGTKECAHHMHVQEANTHGRCAPQRRQWVCSRYSGLQPAGSKLFPCVTYQPARAPLLSV
eukprot:SAG11_NODE_432_length_9520_cov_102.527863_9_plen_118_part_00